IQHPAAEFLGLGGAGEHGDQVCPTKAEHTGGAKLTWNPSLRVQVLNHRDARHGHRKLSLVALKYLVHLIGPAVTERPRNIGGTGPLFAVMLNQPEGLVSEHKFFHHFTHWK